MKCDLASWMKVMSPPSHYAKCPQANEGLGTTACISAALQRISVLKALCGLEPFCIPKRPQPSLGDLSSILVIFYPEGKRNQMQKLSSIMIPPCGENFLNLARLEGKPSRETMRTILIKAISCKSILFLYHKFRLRFIFTFQQLF